MAYSGIDALDSLRRLAGPGANPGRRILALVLVLLVALLLGAFLVFALGAGWSLAARTLATLLLAGLAGAACLAVLKTSD